LAIKENGGVVQTVALAAYVSEEKSQARSDYMRELYIQAADSLSLPYYDRSQFRSLTGEQQQAYMENRPKIRALGNELAASRTDAPEPTNVADFVDHIDYMVNLIGIDHVGISSDFDGGGGIEGWSDASETFNVTLELVKRGYTQDEIEKLWGGNLLRVLDEVEAIAKTLQQ
jgi:membrane dipeptidase